MIKSLVLSLIFLSLYCVAAIAQVAYQPTVGAMQMQMTTGFASGVTTTSVQGYYAAGTGAGQWVWNSSGTCGVAWCLPAISPGTGSYIFTGGTVIDPLALGAHEDVQRLSTTVTVTSGNCNVTVASASFSSADTGKNIVITDAISGAANGPTYAGAIQSGSSGTSVIVSPCPTFSTSQAQYVYYGHDDSSFWNIAIAYAGSPINPGMFSGQPQINGSGRASGVFAAPINVNQNVSLANFDLVALGVTNLPISSSGVLEIGSTYSGNLYGTADAAFLPVNACYASGNGANSINGWNNLQCKNWLGSSQTTVSLTGARTQSTFTPTGFTSGCSATAPYTCTLTITSGRLSGGYIGTPGANYAVNDTITLSPVGGSQITAATITVNSITTGGSVATFTVTSPGLFSTPPTSFTQASTSGLGSGFTMSGPTYTFDTVQPGWGLSDGGVKIPNGTYVQGVLSPTANTYTIWNLTTAPTASSPQSITPLTLDVTVSSCSAGVYNDIGLVSHGNSSIGIADRTFIVGCPNSTTIVLNKAPTRQFSGAILTFSQDANGFYLASSAAVQMKNLTVSQDDYTSVIGNHYGCGIFNDSANGSTFGAASIGYGAANICQGPDALNNQYRQVATFGIAAAGGTEVNSPAFLSMDHAQNTVLNDFSFGGQIQAFAISAGSNTQFSMNKLGILSESTQVAYAPNNTIWLYTEQSSESSNTVTLDKPIGNSNSFGNPYELAFTTNGGSSSWQQFTSDQIASLSRQMIATLSMSNQQTPVYPGPLSSLLSENPPIIDVRSFGAWEDVQGLKKTVTTTTGSCAVSVTGGSFSAATDVGKYIVITDAISGSPNGLTYSSTIVGVSSATSLTVAAPCPAFTTSQAQRIYYGHDDAAAWNTAIAYLGTYYAPDSGIGGQPVLTTGGRASGVFSASIDVDTNVALENVNLVALGTAHLPLNTGVLVIGSSYSTGLNVTVDGAYLPVNACYANSNGTVWWNNLRCKNWLGSGSRTQLTGVSTLPEDYITGSIGATFTGTGAGTNLTVSGVTGVIHPGSASSAPITGTGVPSNTYLVSQTNGTTGGAGTYVTNNTTTAMGASISDASNILDVSATTIGLVSPNVITSPVGSGYADGDTITLAPTGGTQQAAAVVQVTNISGAGGVREYVVLTRGGFGMPPTSFTQSSTSGVGTGFSISAPTFTPNLVQPGQGLSGTSIPSGTYVTQFGTGAGGTGTYTLYSQNTLSLVVSENMTTFGLDLRVTPGGGGSLGDIGQVSHGNASIGVPDRSFVVAYLTDSNFAGRIVLNKAPTTLFSNQALNIYNDSNGLYLVDKI